MVSLTCSFIHSSRRTDIATVISDVARSDQGTWLFNEISLSYADLETNYTHVSYLNRHITVR